MIIKNLAEGIGKSKIKPSMTKDKIERWLTKLHDGRTLSIFLNKDKDGGLFVVDLIDKNGKFGNEFIRMNLENVPAGRPEKKLKRVI
jgi:hypothetical protein